MLGNSLYFFAHGGLVGGGECFWWHRCVGEGFQLARLAPLFLLLHHQPELFELAFGLGVFYGQGFGCVALVARLALLRLAAARAFVLFRRARRTRVFWLLLKFNRTPLRFLNDSWNAGAFIIKSVNFLRVPSWHGNIR